MTRRTILLVVALVALAALVAAGIATRGFGLFVAKGDDPLALNGNVDIREVEMAFRVPGRIGVIAVDEGAKVRAGQLLATLDTASLDSRIGEADAQVQAAAADLARVRNGARTQDVAQGAARANAAAVAAREAAEDYARRQPLVAPGAISRDAWDATVAARDRTQAQLAEARQALSLLRAGSRSEDIAAAAARLRAAQATRRSAGTDLGDTRLIAASGGTIVTRAREPGAIVAPGETVLTLSIDRPVRVRAYIAEPDLSRISPGMAVAVRADGNPRTYRGTIGYIAPRAEFTPKSVETEELRTDLVYRLRIIVSDPDDALRQGQPVSIRVPAARPRHED